MVSKVEHQRKPFPYPRKSQQFPKTPQSTDQMQPYSSILGPNFADRSNLLLYCVPLLCTVPLIHGCPFALRQFPTQAGFLHVVERQDTPPGIIRSPVHIMDRHAATSPTSMYEHLITQSAHIAQRQEGAIAHFLREEADAAAADDAGKA